MSNLEEIEEEGTDDRLQFEDGAVGSRDERQLAAIQEPQSELLSPT